MERDLKTRIQKNAKALRFISRTEMFQRNRKNLKQQLSYLKILDQEQRSLILQSINGPVPSELPPLAPTTISYYRRANRPIFKTKAYQGSQQLHPHMTYESLFILAGIQEMNFPNFQQIIKEFEMDLQKYINCEFSQIREMAMIAAGNKILGKQKDIQRIIELDQKQMWVMVNHIYQRKMTSNHLFPYLKDHNQIVYKSLFQMSNSNDEEIIETIMNDENVLDTLIQSLQHFNVQIRKYTIRIFGNIMAEKDDYVYPLAKYNILEHFYPFLNSNDPELRKDACWAISNFAFQKLPSTILIQNPKISQKLVSMLQGQSEIKIKIQLCHIFSNLVAFAEKLQIFHVVHKGNILERCGQFLQIQDSELIHVALYLISKIIELGDHFADESGNSFIHEIKTLGIKSKIIQKTYYTQNTEISKLSSELEEKLEDDF